MKRKLLIIDGLYFCQRVLGQLNMGDSVNNLETEAEKKNFTSALNNSLINLTRTFNNESGNLIDNIIYVTDSFSWRKEVKPFRPYYIPEDSEQLIGYKEQRKAKKEESPINYDNFYALANEFSESIREQVIVFKIDKLEGDDDIMLITNKLKEHPEIFSIVFATDGDLNQVVKDNVCIMKNVRSKAAPNGEFVISLNLYGKVYEQTMNDALLGSSIDNDYFKQLFRIQIGCTDGSSKIRRELHSGIEIAAPYKTALVKSVAGDKKDNIFSVISWESSTGTRRYSITEKYIEKALALNNYTLTEDNCKKILGSKENMVNLINSLKQVTKQKDVDGNKIFMHVLHNLKMNVLAVNNIPEDYRKGFDTCWNENENRILNENLDFNKLKMLESTQNISRSGVNVLEDSIPEL